MRDRTASTRSTDLPGSRSAALALLLAASALACDRPAPPPDADAGAMDAPLPPRGDGSRDALPGDAVNAPDATPDALPPPGACMRARGVPVSGSEQWPDSDGRRASVTVPAPGECLRAYTLASNAPLRDNQPANPRTYSERAGWPTLRTGHLMFDALYALALEETRENSVAQIRDGAFDNGRPLACPAGGCFETGRLWTYAWTRDSSYAVHLGLGALDPTRARNTLEFKLSERRAGGDLQIVQDTGTGGSYPVSTDRVVWALGAWELLKYLDGAERDAFLARAYEALRNTLEHDRAVAYDPTEGLYAGEQSFLDWREQTYPSWTGTDTVHVGMSRALSTNVAHHAALDIAAQMAALRGDSAGEARYRGQAAMLRDAINTRFFLADRGLYATFIPGPLDPAPVARFDALGEALAVLTGVADAARAPGVIARYPHAGRGGLAVVWPQEQDTPIYHNRAAWPFVTAYWLRAARRVRNDAAVDRGVTAMVRAAALNLSNMENLEFVSGAPFVSEGPTSGPVVNSQRQLWSVAGYVSMVHDVLFGLDARQDGAVRFAPYVTRRQRATLFAGSESIVLNDFPFRGRRITVVVNLPAATPTDATRGGAYAVDSVRVDGRAVEPADAYVPLAMLGAAGSAAVVEVTLADRGETPGATVTAVDDTAEYRNLFAPRPPAITTIEAQGGRLRLALDRGREAAADVTFNVFRDGRRVATGLPGATDAWVDPESGDFAQRTHCYTAEMVFVRSGNASHHAAARCYWGARFERIQTVLAHDFANNGGAPSTMHGRFHYENWGDPGHTLVVPYFRPNFSGEQLLQLSVGNGAGAFNTGITCAVKRVAVEELPAGTLVAEGYVMAPHAGAWSAWRDSSFVRARLDASRTYRITIGDAPRAVNMSAFRHFTAYTGGTGGAGGAFNRVNVSELRVLPLTGLPAATGALVALDGAGDFADFAAANRVAPAIGLDAADGVALDWDADFVYLALNSRALETFSDRPFVLYVQSAAGALPAAAARNGITYFAQTPTVPFEADHAVVMRWRSDVGDGAGPFNGVLRWTGSAWARATRFVPGRDFFASGGTMAVRIPRAQLGLPARVRVAGHVVSGGGNYNDVVPAEHQPWVAGRTTGFYEIDLSAASAATNWVRR